MPRIYLVRHGESLANVARIMSSTKADLPLSERGLVQARLLGEWFRERPLAGVYASPLLRARQTAQPIAAAHGVAVTVDEALRELRVGIYDGEAGQDAWDAHELVLQAWRAGDHDLRFPGGENFHEARARLGDFLARAANAHPAADVAVVGHTGLYSLVLPVLCAVPGHDGVSPLRLGNTSVTVLQHGNGELACELWGGLDHLPEADRTGLGRPALHY